MTKLRHNRVGIGALIAYAALVVATAFSLFELGSEQLGYSSLTGWFLPKPAAHPDAGRRYGKMQIRSDYKGHCREYSLDNKTQELVSTGTVVCDQQQYERNRQRTRADVFREAFGGQH